ncbi:MAG: Mth938-like domain-containing protein [Pseudomonadota bacterium]
MKIAKQAPGTHTIQAYDLQSVTIDGQRYVDSLIVSADQLQTSWTHPGCQKLTLDDLSVAIAQEPELIVLGCGNVQQFPPTALLAALASRGVGLEVMTCAAACRTFNLLVAEGRNAVAALMLSEN